jgi:hypothetical protein
MSWRKIAIGIGAMLMLSIAVSGREPSHAPLGADAHPVLAIGSPAPDFSLPGIDDKIHKLSDVAYWATK